MQAIVAYADSIHPYRDGRSSERVLDAIDAFIAAGARNRKPKPMNLWRKLKIRKRIGYWGPASGTKRRASGAATPLAPAVSSHSEAVPQAWSSGERDSRSACSLSISANRQ